MTRRLELVNQAAVDAFKQIVDAQENSFINIFKAGVKWADHHPIGVLDEDFCWAVYNYINEWKAGNFGQISLQEALRVHPLDY